MTFGSVARLVGYGYASDRNQLVLYWQALGATERPYTVFVHLFDEHGAVAGYGDSEPGLGAYPTTGWRKGEYLSDPHELHLSSAPQVEPSWRVEVGLYDPTTGERLRTQDGQDSATLRGRP